MKQLQCRIVENKKIAADFYKMRIESPHLAKNSKPGQFVEIRCSEKTDPLLRRPLGCHRILRDGIEMLYEVVGKGTELLSHKKMGESLDVIGPLGNGFTLNTKRYPLNTILVAGGIGVAPLLALVESLAYSIERLPAASQLIRRQAGIAYSKKRKIDVFIGAKTKSHILCDNDFKKLGCEIHISTEDGSMGKKGVITKLLVDFLNASATKIGGSAYGGKRYTLPPKTDPSQAESAIIYACGPNAMLKEIAYIAKAKRMACQVSLEEHMACGVGACLGCPVKVKSPYTMRGTQYEYKMVCKDGPVFNAEEIAW
ncbi:MAG: dihydroorotate dehydrogenase electron transfer subunit [Candidatus Omnitrophota bacterium]|nr:dihydroorotate dehydrogenase electron transfer subunit [Candidatus Omnitrophota bacterium]